MNELILRAFYQFYKFSLDCTGIVYKKIFGKILYPLNYDSILMSLSETTRNAVLQEEYLKKAVEYLVLDTNNIDHLGVFGRNMIRDMIIEGLERRTQIDAAIEKDPDILNTNIDDPVVILTLPRTGSTFFQHLLHHDKNWKCPELWEMDTVLPLIHDPLTEENKQTIQSQIEALNYFRYFFPRKMDTAHSMGSTDPEDMLNLHAMEGLLLFPILVFEFPNYVSYFENLPEEEWIKIYKRIKNYYKIIGRYQNMDKRRFLLMFHTFAVGSNPTAFAKVFPDAQYIAIHRNVTKIIPSLSSLTFYISKLFTDPGTDDQDYLSRVYTERILSEVRRMPSWRNHKLFLNDNDKERKKIIDVNFEDLIENLFPTLEKLYKELNMELSEETRKAMETYVEKQNRHKYGKHKYRKVTVDIDYIKEVAENYTKTYNIKNF